MRIRFPLPPAFCAALCTLLFLLCAGCGDTGSAVDSRVTGSGTWSIGVSTGKKF